ncbi:hypothetical protein DPEC_G00053950 [Dallia pectoralis]|uniref:Uncharacterized protein n=1 Tax=Dallia pectoralis TaxID=75939 RepID=A0ACC2H516_DALPE|nr:hypothetical protein DPEC_G00053950 [Dallia pectoralis]
MAEKKTDKGSKLEVLKALEKCKKERDEAVQKESVLKERLRQYESRARSTEALKQKQRALIQENKELRKQVKTLRQEIGLETSPKFRGKTTKDVINDLQEKELQCFALEEKTGKLSVTIDNLTSELANTVTSKFLLEEQVQSLQQNLKDMTSNQRRLLKLWEDKKPQREQLTLPAIGQTQKPVQKLALSHKGAQTDMSISSVQKLPANAFETKPSSPQPRHHERHSSIDQRGGLTASGNGPQLGKAPV